jgi:hypothetical protein
MPGTCSAATATGAEKPGEIRMQNSNIAAETVTIDLLYMSNNLYYDARGHSTGPVAVAASHVDAFYCNINTGEQYGH